MSETIDGSERQVVSASRCWCVLRDESSSGRCRLFTHHNNAIWYASYIGTTIFYVLRKSITHVELVYTGNELVSMV